VSEENVSAALAQGLLTILAFDNENAGIVRNSIELDDFIVAVQRHIAMQLYAYLDEYGKPPGDHLPDLFEEDLEDQSQGSVYREEIEAIIDLRETINTAYVLNRLEDWSRRQRFTKGLRAAYRLVESGSMDEAENVMKDAMRKSHAAQGKPGTIDGNDFDQLLETEMADPDMLVPGMASKGLLIIAGRPKSRKSLTALHLALCVRSGRQVFGQHAVLKKGRVLYLALEDNPRRMHKRGRAMRQFYRRLRDQRIDIRYSWPRGDVAGLRHYLVEHPDTALIIIDTFGRFRKSQGRAGEYSYQVDVDALAELQRLAMERSITIAVVHHTRKAPATEDPLDEISGTTGITSVADTIWMMKTIRGEDRGELFVDGRDIVEARRLALRWDRELVAWRVEGDAEVMRVSAERQEVLDALTEPMTVKALERATGKKYHAVRKLAEALVADGLAVRSLHGEYLRAGGSD